MRRCTDVAVADMCSGASTCQPPPSQSSLPCGQTRHCRHNNQAAASEAETAAAACAQPAHACAHHSSMTDSRASHSNNKPPAAQPGRSNA